MHENAHIHLVSRYLQVASKYLLVLAEISGVEWGCQRLYDKSNDKLYAPAQLLPYQQYKKERQETHEEWMTNIKNCCVVQEKVS